MDMSLDYTALNSGLSKLTAAFLKNSTALKIAGAAAAFGVCLKLIHNYTRTPFPGPNVISVLRLPFLSPEKQVEWLTNIANYYGKICSFRLFGTTVVLVSDMKIFREITKKRPKAYSRVQVPNLLGQVNVVFAEGDAWRVHRKIVSRPLIDSNVDILLPMICSVADKLVQHIRSLSNSNGVVSRWAPEEYLLHAASKIASAFYVGEADPGQSKGTGISRRVAIIISPLRALSFIRRELELGISPIAVIISQFPVLAKFHPKLRRYGTVLLEAFFLHQLFADWEGQHGLKASWQSIIENNLSKQSQNSRTQLPSILEHAGKEYDMEELMSTLHMFLGAGSDTVAGSLGTLLKYMCLNPGVQDRARAEALSLDRDPETTVELDKLIYLRACILESLRLNTLGPVLPVAALRDCEIDGRSIRAGTRIIIMFKKLQEDSYENGGEFRPERWLSEDGKTVDLEKSREFTGFGCGPRACPGRHLAMKELLIYLSRILRNFKNMRLAEGSTAESKFISLVVMHPQDLRITMEVVFASNQA
ncbi:hypothetical protein FOL47_004629 [Perkinsus chesapeaki]|uniref:Cytochrome P450-dit2 n=1 Tax=Perkinsus chesapeaki TaxID=330153 RepID=A0A7J6M1N5_PERCH|nr:hypothetical protein FOL47_004629 [Perkinsus chesapeaki]